MEVDTNDRDSANPSEEKVELKREIGLISATNLTLNLIIGSGIFITPGQVLDQSGSIGMSLLVWALCGFISLLGALAFAELSTVVPKSGGCYAYFQASFKDMHSFFGPLPGFIFIWVMLIIVVPATLAIVAILFADYVYEPFRPSLSREFNEHFEALTKTIIGAVTLVIMGIINYSSVKLYLMTQNLLSFIKLFGCLYVIFGGIFMVASGKAIIADFGFEGTKLTPHSLVAVFYGGLYSYDGWSWLSGVTEEIKNPEKNIIRSTLFGVLIVTIIFVGMNTSYTTALTVNEIVNGTAVAVQFGDRVFGPGKIIISIAVAISVVGAALSWVFYASRLGYVAAREGQMWGFISYIHRTRLTPAPAVLLEVILSLMYYFMGYGLETLINFYTFLMWISYGLTMVSLFVLRYKMPSANRPFKVPLCIPFVVLLVALCLSIFPLYTQPPMQFVTCFSIVGVGVILYSLFIYMKIKIPGLDKCQDVLQVWMNVVPPQEEPKL